MAAPPTPNVNNRPGKSTELNQDNIPIRTNQSETTIYHRAVESKRDSSSSEEIMDLSDETSASQFSIDHVHAVSESRSGDQPRQPTTELRNRYVHDDAQLHSSRQEALSPPMRHQGGGGDREMTVQVEDLVRVAEASKARIYEVPGKLQTIEKYLEWPDLFHSVLVDEDYLVVGTHVDEATKRKIITGDYVDFSKLIPRNKVSAEDNHRMEIVNYSGQTFWIPASDRNAVVISNFIRWEQAFHVFSNIYTQQYPGHSSELIQYNHIIHTASLTYQWENVYQYDKEFRLHLIRHPECSWGVILQQAWSMYLKDKISANNQGGPPPIHINRLNQRRSVMISTVVTVAMQQGANLIIIVVSVANTGMEHIIAERPHANCLVVTRVLLMNSGIEVIIKTEVTVKLVKYTKMGERIKLTNKS